MSERSFSSKILLFGEYTVIGGAEALAIPYHPFSAYWGQGAPAHDWNTLLRFLTAHPELEIDGQRLSHDLSQGGGFISNIPQGKGLGSSGALVAALLYSYGPKREWTLSEAKEHLAALESCFHGQSSGVDPLVSWVGKPLALEGARGVEVVDLPIERWASLDRWFLYDSGVARHSAPLVAVFKKKIENPEFAQRLEDLKGLVRECIENYEHLDEPMMGISMQALSRLQLSVFQEMIPPQIQSLWREGLESKQFALKLCGAGGGGFFIGYRIKSSPSKVLKF